MTGALDVRPYGDAAVLVEPADAGRVLALRAVAARLAGVLEVVPAARTLLVRFDPGATGPDTLATALAGALAAGTHAEGTGADGTDFDSTDSDSTDSDSSAAAEVSLAVRYDGADLRAVADELRCSTDALVRRHAAGRYTVAFCGFVPGFAYLTGLDPALHVPRLSTPRTRVPAGTVGIADEFTGVYPRASPGGWRLLGHTDAALWDLERTPPALLVPGTRVRFVPR